MRLIDDLRWVSERWVAEHQRTNDRISLKTLSSRATNDGKLFARIDAGRPIAVPTYETCIAYLSREINWPAGNIPNDVRTRLVSLGAISEKRTPKAA